MKTIEEKKDCIVDQLKDYLNGKTAVIGISGGIDSAVVAALCAEAQGGSLFPYLCAVSLPYGNQDTSDAEELAASLGMVSLFKHDIKPAVDAIINQNMNQLVKGNAMARIRMVCLYAFSNQFNGIVVGTTNRSEAEVGYFTKYGDGAVDIEPIASLWKREVYEMGKLLNIPESIMTKAPSANLWEGQTDEGEFGFTYDDIELYFTSKEKGINPPLTKTPYAYEKIETLIKCNEHKKHLPPAFKT